MSLTVEPPCVLYRDPRYYSAFPTLARTRDGGMMLAFRRAPDHRALLRGAAPADFDHVDHLHARSHIALVSLDGHIRQGQPAVLPVDSLAADQDANLFTLRDGRLLQYGFLWLPVTQDIAWRLKAEGRSLRMGRDGGGHFMFWGAYVRHSDDNGETWSDRRFLPRDPRLGEGIHPDCPNTTALRGRMVERDDGGLVLAGYTHGLVGPGTAVQIFASTDRGLSWDCLADLTGPDGPEPSAGSSASRGPLALMEPALAAWPDNRLSLFMRTNDPGDRLAAAGLTGSGLPSSLAGAAVTLTGIVGHPADGLVLPDGRLLLVYGYRHRGAGVRARLLEPGQPFDTAREYILHEHCPGYDCGYPWAERLEDGRVLVAFYAADGAGVRGIDGVVVHV
ncbi:sialidase family protein [Eilatimonas milleporae]|uniref:BNR repeat protein n=1 Tax=Eilatimonas milleporae TaxID=911205 RepID=A0A3M0CQG2_9PROT|nr:sialidase family protein [Eilatimonas milleporae]RMB11788.1 BNR repeat protein [Eilatimonas milleporae]